MTSKRIYLFLTGSLLLLGVSTGFAMQNQQSYQRTALNALETANVQLSKAVQSPSSRQAKALQLIRQAIHEMKAELPTPEQGLKNKTHPTT